MDRGKFISEVLVKYSAFYNRFIRYAGIKSHACLVFNWKIDTMLAGKPILDADDILYDYSVILHKDVTKETYNDFLRDPCAGVAMIKISSISKERAEEIMYNNMLTLEKLPKLIVKADNIKRIMEE